MLQACRTPDTDVSLQTEPDFDNEKIKNDEEIEGLMSELKKELEVRNLAIFYSNFMESLTCDFPSVLTFPLHAIII
jgi:hypothetical protein